MLMFCDIFVLIEHLNLDVTLLTKYLFKMRCVRSLRWVQIRDNTMVQTGKCLRVLLITRCVVNVGDNHGVVMVTRVVAVAMATKSI